MATEIETQTGRVSRFVIMSGWVLLIIVCLSLVVSVCYLAVRYPEAKIPEDLTKLAYAAVGFLFGSFPALLKDLLTPKLAP